MDDRVRGICVCPACRSPLTWSDTLAACVPCGRDYPLSDSVPILLDSKAAPAVSEEWNPGGAMRLLPARLRPLAARYRHRINPVRVYRSAETRGLPRRFAASFSPDAIVLNVGSGETEYGPNVVNVDIAPLRGVDIVGLAERLPVRDRSCDAVILETVLEHVRWAGKTLSEIHRVLKPSGSLLVEVPFIQGFHAGPGDYRRYTEPGLRAELEDHGFEVEASGVATGPANAMAWAAAEFLALVASGRSADAYRLLRPMTAWITAPVMYLDRWLDRHPMAYTLASEVWVRARTPAAARVAPPSADT